ncbi:MAG TPA: hypothetical protein VNU46_03200 [Gemmatimonadaceae bacterium]|nr:hypothetical protein [Gemmatimonadaceae bacterium]
MTRSPRFVVGLLLGLAPIIGASRVAHAQGALSLQGFGYPTGELSTRAEGTAGATGEIDGRSPLNPAALAIGAQSGLYMQYDPELRSVSSGGMSSSTTTSRFPNVGVMLPFMGHWVVGLSASTFLDRTWQTQASSVENIGPDTVTRTQILRSEGGITDVRLALAYAINSRIRIGIGGHGYSGSDRIALTQQFADTLDFRDFSETTSLRYAGNAVSGGVEVDLLPSLSLSVSGRAGGTLRMYTGDTLLSTGRVPNHYAGSLTFQGIPGTLLAVRVAHDQWSSLSSLSVDTTATRSQAIDANDVSAGVESNGPHLGDQQIAIRLGVRVRTLPFDLGMTPIHETSFGGGLGIPLAQNHAVIDLALLHSDRHGVSGISESAYNFSIGLSVRP